MSDRIEHARRLLADVSSVAVLTGAGISAESGVPVFRGPQGMWNNMRPEDIATPEAFARDPAMVWRWYRSRLATVRKVEPNAGHTALAALERRVKDFTLATQNVDGLHLRAGSRNVLELHGNIGRNRCDRCGLKHEAVPEPEDAPLPRCVECGGIERPDVVLFGEMLPEGIFEEAASAAARCQAFLVIGTSGVVQPAAMLADIAAGNGATVIEVNLEQTPLSLLATVTLLGASGEILPRIV